MVENGLYRADGYSGVPAGPHRELRASSYLARRQLGHCAGSSISSSSGSHETPVKIQARSPFPWAVPVY